MRMHAAERWCDYSALDRDIRGHICSGHTYVSVVASPARGALSWLARAVGMQARTRCAAWCLPSPRVYAAPPPVVTRLRLARDKRTCGHAGSQIRK
jgi:hypothetical protein